MKSFTAVEVLLLLSSLAWIDLAEGSVDLTIEGGVSLVGPHCPGTLKLFCEGTDLTALRWSYNGGLRIVTFGPDDSKTTNTPSSDQFPAFVLVELTKAVQNLDLVFGNFSSILTVDLSKLEEQNVTDISCGDPRTTQTEPVGVTIIQQDIPDSPNITEVTATYDSAGLKRITVVWNKVSTGCPEYVFSLDYIVQLNGSVPLRVNHSSCGEISCLATFNTPFSQSNPVNSYFLSLMAMNNIGTSSTVQFPTVIPSQSEQYITPVLSSSGCITSGQCLSSGSLQNDTIIILCHVQYSTDPEYQGLSTAIMAPLNTLFQVPLLPPETIFYFVFSVGVTYTFHVNEQFELTTGSGPRLTSNNMATIAFAVVFVTVSLILFISSIIIICVDHVRDSTDHGRCLKATVLVLAVIYVLLLVSCLALLIAVGVIIGTQEDTCKTDWLQQRDRLTILTLIISLSSVLASLAMMVTVLFYIYHRRKRSHLRGLSYDKDMGEEQQVIVVGGAPQSSSRKSRISNLFTRRKPKASQPSHDMQSPVKSGSPTDTRGTGERPSNKNTNSPDTQKPPAQLLTENKESGPDQGDAIAVNEENQGFTSQLHSSLSGGKETVQASDHQSTPSLTDLQNKYATTREEQPSDNSGQLPTEKPQDDKKSGWFRGKKDVSDQQSTLSPTDQNIQSNSEPVTTHGRGPQDNSGQLPTEKPQDDKKSGWFRGKKDVSDQQSTPSPTDQNIQSNSEPVTRQGRGPLDSSRQLPTENPQYDKISEWFRGKKNVFEQQSTPSPTDQNIQSNSKPVTTQGRGPLDNSGQLPTEKPQDDKKSGWFRGKKNVSDQQSTPSPTDQNIQSNSKLMTTQGRVPQDASEELFSEDKDPEDISVDKTSGVGDPNSLTQSKVERSSLTNPSPTGQTHVPAGNKELKSKSAKNQLGLKKRSESSIN